MRIWRIWRWAAGALLPHSFLYPLLPSPILSHHPIHPLNPSADVPYLQSPLPHPSHLFPSLLSPRLPYLSYSTLPPLPYPTIISPLLPFPRIPSPTYLPTFPRTRIIPLHSLPSAPLLPIPSPPLSSPTLPCPLPYHIPPDSSHPNPTVLSLLLLFPRIPSPTYLPTLAPLSYPCIPYSPLPSHPLPSPYHIHQDRFRGRNISFVTSLGYLNPSLLYPPLPYHPNTPLPYTTHLPPTFPLLYPRIPSTPLISPALIPYPTVPSPTLSSHLLSSPTSPPISFGLPCSTQRFRKSQRPRCYGTRMYRD